MRGFSWLVLVGGCALTPKPPTPPESVVMVVAEQGPRGIRLVAIDEHGDRRFELITPADAIVRDANPAVSPDGKWLVFASTRGRSDGGTSLWIAPLIDSQTSGATPSPLTTGPSIDQHAVWTRDGRAIVFASTREGGDFDLWRLDITAGKPGATTQLTTGPGHEVMPTLAADGTILYAAITQQHGLEVESHLEERAPDGTIRAITAGPADTSPSLSPDGATLVFARPSVHMGTPHADLWRIDHGAWRSSGADLPATRLVDLPITDESGPVWSHDGRFVFATSVLRGDHGKVVFSSIIFIDLQDKVPHARMLRDHASAVVRLTPAIRSEHLDAATLATDPEYLPELARIMASAIADQSAPLPDSP